MSDEPSDAQKLIRAAMRKHRIGWYGNHDKRCFACPGTSFFDWDEADAHVAAEVDKALGGLTREWGAQMVGDDEVTVGSEGTARYCARQHPKTWNAMSRFVSGWTVTE
ncbi:hypothetical protein [Mycobacteroides abscessus]|uniref:hypothetical protein n=1 Tax=Mycobacteroides abscessus TaxID=36809 RepID=UPI00092BD05C|nr:hypothetical protein [Mycobacteroides abscessus]SIC86936.1 Uncharacterised protein [Mycobacteroides abscessus subsp. bolletii]SKT75382.1 Uncharacterised protein [Mycobacteroides abscessus subsp. bolletii]SLD35322.1 Uncharacterised protein [Mycobacteroides abscessus subsp. bolletii]SLF79562.1 Uncharacterised protein [Mycobacteroides abscessus subsp. bolletii]